MTPLVIDASAALSWMLPSQETSAARNLLDQLDSFELMAPAIFQFEVFNGLVSLRRRRILTESGYAEALSVLDELQITLDDAIPVDDFTGLASFAQLTGLSLFDSCYLKLALDTGAELVSRDGLLVGVAAHAGVGVHDLRDRPEP
jgi:predicted nucleic acid-binding protein